MDIRINDKYIMESKEIEIKTNKKVPSQYKSVQKTYTEEEVKDLIKQVIKEFQNETNK